MSHKSVHPERRTVTRSKENDGYAFTLQVDATDGHAGVAVLFHVVRFCGFHKRSSEENV
jgi:hypothetical protein